MLSKQAQRRLYLLSTIAASVLSLGSVSATGPTVVIPYPDLQDKVGPFADGSLSTFVHRGTRYWLVAGGANGGQDGYLPKHSKGTGDLARPFTSNVWRRAQEQVFTNPHKLDVVKDDGTYGGVGWIVNTYQDPGSEGILAFVHVESFVPNDKSYYSNGVAYCQLPTPTYLPRIPRYLPQDNPLAGLDDHGYCGVAPTIPVGPFVVGGRRYRSDGPQTYCRHSVTGLADGVATSAALPTGMSSTGECAPLSTPVTVPMGLFNVLDDETYFSNGASVYCRFARTTVMPGIPNYASTPTGMWLGVPCAAPSRIPMGDFIVGGLRYFSNGEDYCRHTQDGAASGLPVYPDFPTDPASEYHGDCVPQALPLPPGGIFNLAPDNTYDPNNIRWAGRLGLAWSEDGGETFRYLGHILSPYLDPSDIVRANVHGVPYLVGGDGNLYVYYSDHACGSSPGSCYPMAAVARAPLASVIADARRGVVSPWHKYYTGIDPNPWASPGLGGPASPVGPNLFGILHTDSAHSTYNGRQYLVVTWPAYNIPGFDPSPGFVKLFESTNFVNWTEVCRVANEPVPDRGQTRGYQYATIVDEGGGDNGVVGRRFYLYSFYSFRDEDETPILRDNSSHRWLIDLDDPTGQRCGGVR